MGERICGDCGYVHETDNLSLESESRVYTPEEVSRVRASGPLNAMLPNNGLYTRVGGGGKGGTELARALDKTQRRVLTDSTKDRNLSLSKPMLIDAANKLSLPKRVLESAVRIYETALDRKLTKGRSMAAMVGASLYYAMRVDVEPTVRRNMLEIGETVNAEPAFISKFYRELVKDLSIRVSSGKPSSETARIIGALEEELGYKLSDVELVAKNIFKYFEKHPSLRMSYIDGRKPAGVSAAVLYAASDILGNPLLKKDLVACSSASEVTINASCREICEAFGIDQTELRMMSLVVNDMHAIGRGSGVKADRYRGFYSRMSGVYDYASGDDMLATHTKILEDIGVLIGVRASHGQVLYRLENMLYLP